MSTYYRDMDRPDVERLARAICTERRINPDQLRPESGWSDAAMIPQWRQFQDDALNFIAMMSAVASDIRAARPAEDPLTHDLGSAPGA